RETCGRRARNCWKDWKRKPGPRARPREAPRNRVPRERKKVPTQINWRLVLGLAGLAVVCVSTAMAGFKVRRFVNTDPQFMLTRDRKDSLIIEGLVYASRSKVLRVFAADFDHSIFKVPLPERRRRLLAV